MKTDELEMPEFLRRKPPKESNTAAAVETETETEIDDDESLLELPDGVEWLHIYWVRGSVPKGYDHRNEVRDPPCAGWQHAFVLRGEKLSTIFCPYSFTSYSVSNDASELPTAREQTNRANRFLTNTFDRFASRVQPASIRARHASMMNAPTPAAPSKPSIHAVSAVSASIVRRSN